MASSERILRLDGLRSIAVVGVMLYHSNIIRAASIGWIGVDLFFVLSGFLITQILRQEREKPQYWRRFYIKRATRILPPLLLLLIFVAFVNHHPIPHLIQYLLFAGNFPQIFGQSVPELVILWSLAVEEHFYLLFPFAVKFLTRETLLKVLTGIVILEPILRGIATLFLVNWFEIYTWTFFRIDGLCFGAMLALWKEDPACVAWLRRWSGKYAFVILTTFLVLWKVDPSQFLRWRNSLLFNTLGYSMLAGGFMFFLAYVYFKETSILSRLLGTRPVVFIGTISYGLYLFHPRVEDFVDQFHMNKLAAFVTFFVGSFLVCAVSFYAVERPIIRFGKSIANQLRGGRQSTQLQVPLTVEAGSSTE